jgi:hypothetical protein
LRTNKFRKRKEKRNKKKREIGNIRKEFFSIEQTFDFSGVSVCSQNDSLVSEGIV